MVLNYFYGTIRGPTDNGSKNDEIKINSELYHLKHIDLYRSTLLADRICRNTFIR